MKKLLKLNPRSSAGIAGIIRRAMADRRPADWDSTAEAALRLAELVPELALLPLGERAKRIDDELRRSLDAQVSAVAKAAYLAGVESGRDTFASFMVSPQIRVLLKRDIAKSNARGIRKKKLSVKAEAVRLFLGLRNLDPEITKDDAAAKIATTINRSFDTVRDYLKRA